MGDFFSDLPGWLKGLIFLGVLGGSNGAQFLGFGAPARDTATLASGDRDWCLDRLAETQEKLETCWKECK